MSKIGKMPIKINTAKIEIKDRIVNVSGPKGEVQVELLETIDISVTDGNVLVVSNNEEDAVSRMYWGLIRSLVNNAVVGVETGFSKTLEMVGVGYRVEKLGDGIKMQIGYSHPVVIKPPKGIAIEVEGNTIIKVSGADRQKVGQLAAEIRAVRKPEPYKGKGIKYKDELIKRKQGKASKK